MKCRCQSWTQTIKHYFFIAVCWAKLEWASSSICSVLGLMRLPLFFTYQVPSLTQLGKCSLGTSTTMQNKAGRNGEPCQQIRRRFALLCMRDSAPLWQRKVIFKSQSQCQDQDWAQKQRQLSLWCGFVSGWNCSLPSYIHRSPELNKQFSSLCQFFFQRMHLSQSCLPSSYTLPRIPCPSALGVNWQKTPALTRLLPEMTPVCN